MLFPRSHAWTRWQRGVIAGAVIAAAVVFCAVVYSYERYYRGPDDNIFIGTWRGEADFTFEHRIGYRFKADRTYETEWEPKREWEPSGKWHAGGEFLYLRQTVDGAGVSVPHDLIQIWHIDSMTETEVRMHDVSLRLHAVLKRVE